MAKKVKRPFAFGLGTVYDGFAKMQSIKALRILLMAGGLYAAGLSAELTILGWSVNPMSKFFPGHEKRQEQAYEEKRFLPKGVADGAEFSRINPFPPVFERLADRTDAIALYGLLGVLGDSREENAVDWIKEKYAEDDVDPESFYDDRTDNWFSNALRTWETPEDSYWATKNIFSTGFNFSLWFTLGCVQGMIWRQFGREFFGKQFNRANTVKKVTASKGAINSAKGYQIAHNWVDVVTMILFCGMLAGSYIFEFAINGNALSAKVPAQLFFKCLAVFGFEATFFMVTKINDTDEPGGETNTAPKQAPKPQPNKGKGNDKQSGN